MLGFLGRREVGAATGKEPREVQFRMRFAEAYPDTEEVRTAVRTFGSWTAIRDSLTPDTPADNHRAEGTGENEWYTPPPSPQELTRLALCLVIAKS